MQRKPEVPFAANPRRPDEGVEFNVLKAAAGENPWTQRDKKPDWDLENDALRRANDQLLDALKAARQFVDDDSPDWRIAKQEILAKIDRAIDE